MHLSDSTCPYTAAQQTTLLDIAAESIAHSFTCNEPLPVNTRDYPEPLQEPRACFVTLRIESQLRGCMGSLKPKRPLVEDVACNAYAAAVNDPRFPRLQSEEFEQLNIHLSILSDVSPITFSSQADLFDKIRPGIDGLVLRSGERSGTLLPAVWDNVNSIEDFWDHLLKKAGLPQGHWDNSLTVSRYTTHSFGRGP